MFPFILRRSLPTVLCLLIATPVRAQWQPNGIPVDVGHGTPGQIMASVNHAGQVLLVWDSLPNDGPTTIKVQRFSAGGTTPWGDPIVVASGRHLLYGNYAIFIEPDPDQGAIVGYQLDDGSWHAQRYAADGRARWGGNGVPILHTTRGIPEQNSFLGLAGGDFLEFGNLHDSLVVQRYSGQTGQPVWAQPTQVCTANGYHFADFGVEHGPWMADDGTGGFVCTWLDERGTFVQRIDGAGNVLWTPFGARVAASTDNGDERLISDGNGGAILTHSDGPISPIYVQRVIDGQPQWGEQGVLLDGSTVLGLCPDGAGGAWIVDRALVSPYGLLVQHVTSQGVRTGPPTTLPTPDPPPQGFAVLNCGRIADGMWVVEGYQVTAARWMTAYVVTADGSVLGGANGTVVAGGRSMGVQERLGVVADERGNLFAAFGDSRFGNEQNDLFANEIALPRHATGRRRLPASVQQPGVEAFPSAVHGEGTMLRITLPRSTRVDLVLFGVDGRITRRLVRDETMAAGAHEVRWDGTDDSGRRVAPGVYFAQVRSDAGVSAARIALLR